ncbi:MAG: c-type cytochrome [Chloroflexi bacterium]|nr:c-type cytochrome [Chloroflexota bacterium]
MFVNILVQLGFIAVVVLFAFLTLRAWGSKNAILKWGGVVLSGLLTLVALAITGVALMGMLKTYAPPGNPVSNIKVQGTPEQIARGEKFANMCTGCHSVGNKLPLIGSTQNFALIPNGPNLGSIYPPNLTPAGELKDWSDGEIIRALREGIHKSGRPLIIMPSEAFHSLSDADVYALVAYLRSQPATKNIPESDAPSNSPNMLGVFMLSIGMFNTSAQPPITQPIPAPPPGVNLENGKYLTTVLACADCHGKSYKGGDPSGFAPVGPNILAIVPAWSDADFIKLFRTGTDPAGKVVAEEMPWKDYAKFSDDELKAILMYLKSLK